MQLVLVLIIVAASIVYVVWSVRRTWMGKSCNCRGCRISDAKDPER